MQHGQLTLPTGFTVRDAQGGEYVVEALLGQGQSGAVYLVTQKFGSHSQFALKERFTPSEQERERFIFEGRLLQSLHHPSLPRVYRIFEHDALKRSYLLMDYVAGRNLNILRQEQADSRFSLSLVLLLVAPIANAVIYLHQHTPPILHRDIKPANIVVPSNAQSAVLVDFGTAKPFVVGAATAVLKDTSTYAAPEQYIGGTTPRTDIYGLAATLYTLLTGRVPPSALSRLVSRTSDPLLPAHQLVSTLPLRVSQALHRALALDSEARFATVEAFWKELTTDAALAAEERPALLLSPSVSADNGQAQTSTTTSSAANVHRVPRRRRYLLFLLVLVLVLLLLGGVIALKLGIL
jgi:serine/threonine protein kinase